MGFFAPIYTANGLEIAEGRKVFYYPVSRYIVDPVLPIGQTKIGRIPLAFGSSNYQEGDIITHGFFFLSFKTDWHVIPLSKEGAGSNFKSCLVFLETPVGARGTNHHLLEDGSDLQILAEGEIELGKKGSVGKGKHIALILPINKSLKVTITGKYSGPKTLFYEFDGSILSVKTWSQKVFDPIRFE